MNRTYVVICTYASYDDKGFGIAYVGESLMDAERAMYSYEPPYDRTREAVIQKWENGKHLIELDETYYL